MFSKDIIQILSSFVFFHLQEIPETCAFVLGVCRVFSPTVVN